MSQGGGRRRPARERAQKAGETGSPDFPDALLDSRHQGKTQLATKADLEALKHKLTICVGAMILALEGFLGAIKFMGN